MKQHVVLGVAVTLVTVVVVVAAAAVVVVEQADMFGQRYIV